MSALRDVSADAMLWAAVAQQAQAWSHVPLVQRFARELPRNSAGPRSGLPRLLEEVSAMGGGTWIEVAHCCCRTCYPG
jgi:hypothetical protein